MITVMFCIAVQTNLSTQWEQINLLKYNSYLSDGIVKYKLQIILIDSPHYSAPQVWCEGVGGTGLIEMAKLVIMQRFFSLKLYWISF